MFRALLPDPPSSSLATSNAEGEGGSFQAYYYYRAGVDHDELGLAELGMVGLGQSQQQQQQQPLTTPTLTTSALAKLPAAPLGIPRTLSYDAVRVINPGDDEGNGSSGEAIPDHDGEGSDDRRSHLPSSALVCVGLHTVIDDDDDDLRPPRTAPPPTAMWGRDDAATSSAPPAQAAAAAAAAVCAARDPLVRAGPTTSAAPWPGVATRSITSWEQHPGVPLRADELAALLLMTADQPQSAGGGQLTSELAVMVVGEEDHGGGVDNASLVLAAADDGLVVAPQLVAQPLLMTEGGDEQDTAAEAEAAVVVVGGPLNTGSTQVAPPAATADNSATITATPAAAAAAPATVAASITAATRRPTTGRAAGAEAEVCEVAPRGPAHRLLLHLPRMDAEVCRLHTAACAAD